MAENIIQLAARTITRFSMIESGDRIIVAISGGPDSVTLAHILSQLRQKWQLHLILAHLNHGLRGTDSDKDLKWVSELARKWDLPLETEKLTSPLKGSLEHAAREARYRFLEKVRKAHRAQRIALGHHTDDLAETVLINMLRGAYISGMAGIPPVRGPIIRPLIETSRAEIIDYLKQRGLAYRIDESNQDTRFLRNRIRHELLPLMESYTPGFKNTLIKNAWAFRSLAEYMQNQALEIIDQVADSRNGGLRLSLASLLALPQAIRIEVYRQAIAKIRGNLSGIGRVHLKAIESLALSARPNASLDLPGNIRAVREYGSMYIIPRTQEVFKAPEPVQLKIPGEVNWPMPRGRIIIQAERKENIGQKTLIDDSYQAFMDINQITTPLIIRPFKPGDRMNPLGMEGTRKGKSILQEIKVPRADRPFYPVISVNPREGFAEDRGGIVWIPGYRIANSARMRKYTKTVINLTARFEQG